jgi:uncharacterized protein YdeI (YjbR/CyaY-like superfamily)
MIIELQILLEEVYMNKMSKPDSWLVCSDIRQWHDWLVTNYLTKTEVWLQIRKVHSEEIGIKIDEAVEEAICYGWIDGRMYSIDESKYILRFTPRRSNSFWSKKNRKRAEVLIETGRMTDIGMKKVKEAQKNGHWENAY